MSDWEEKLKELQKKIIASGNSGEVILIQVTVASPLTGRGYSKQSYR